MWDSVIDTPKKLTSKSLIPSNLSRCTKVFFRVVVCFSNPTSPPRTPIGSVPCVPSYTLGSLTFKGLTRGMSFKHPSPVQKFFYMCV